MACFLVPLAEACVVSTAKFVYSKIAAKKVVSDSEKVLKVEALCKKVSTLEKMLWGGSVMLVIDHIMSGELVFYPPFLTAMRCPEDIPHMLEEIRTTGVAMAVAVTALWAGWYVVNAINSRKNKNIPEKV